MRPSKAQLIVLAMFPLALYPVISNAAGSAGRNRVRCTQACEEIVIACDTRSVADCQSSYGGDEKLYDACRVAGKTACLDMEQECLLVCMSYKDSQPVEP